MWFSRSGVRTFAVFFRFKLRSCRAGTYFLHRHKVGKERPEGQPSGLPPADQTSSAAAALLSPSVNVSTQPCLPPSEWRRNRQPLHLRSDRAAKTLNIPQNGVPAPPKGGGMWVAPIPACSLLPTPYSLLPAACSLLPPLLPTAYSLLPPLLPTAYSLLPTAYSLPYSLLPAPCSLLPTPCSLLPAPCSLLPTPYSLLPAPCSLLPTPCSRVNDRRVFFLPSGSFSGIMK